MAPANDADAVRIDVRVLRSKDIDRRHDVVNLAAAVVDGVEQRLSVPEAASIFRCDDHVPFARRFANVRDVVLVQMTANVLVDPDQGGMALRAAQMQRLKYECRDIEIAYPTAVGNLLHLHVTFAGLAPFRIRTG